jgi:hypothetical protein
VESPFQGDPGDLPTEVVQQIVGQAVPYAAWSPPRQLQEWRPS